MSVTPHELDPAPADGLRHGTREKWFSLNGVHTRRQWRQAIRRRRWAAGVVTLVMLIPAGAHVLSTVKSVAYRRGYRMVELRGGMVGYYANPGYKNFAWLDRGRDEGLLVTSAASVPPGPYRVYTSTPRLTEIYFKLWHLWAVAGVGTLAAWRWAWWRERPGRCFRCGYALGGLNVDAEGRVSCPECGGVDDERRASRE